ncbi:MAG TPA: carboxypeptidase regulatory-like domain-containing protein [Longimicrobiales bacterium]
MRKVFVGLLMVTVGTACSSDGGPPTGNNQTGTITGQVVDADSGNAGLAGVTVQLTRSGASQTVTTNASGSFSLASAAAGSWQAAVQLPAAYRLAAGEGGTRTATVSGGQTATLSPFQLARPRGTASGTATENGTGVAGGTVTATRGGFSNRTATPNASGYTLNDLPVGPWSLTYTPPNTHVLAQGENGTRNVTVTENQTATVSAFLLAPAPPQPAIVEITASGTSFSQRTVTIPVGTTVRWINGDGVTHTVTPQNTSQPGVWQAATLSQQGATLEHTFNVAGQTYNYRCVPHSSDFNNGMVGTIIVQ